MLFRSPFAQAVSAETMSRVVKVVKTYIIPAYRYLLDDDGNMSTFDRWVLDYVTHYCDRPSITMSDIKKGARRQFDRMKVTHTQQQSHWIMNSMGMLEDKGWVGRVDDGSQEHRGFAEWLINPAIMTAFKDYRKAVIKAKRAQFEEIYDTAQGRIPKRNMVHHEDLLDVDY